jgi:hypothetical protein
MLGFQPFCHPTSLFLRGPSLNHLSAQVRANGGNIALAFRHGAKHVIVRGWAIFVSFSLRLDEGLKKSMWKSHQFRRQNFHTARSGKLRRASDHVRRT